MRRLDLRPLKKLRNPGRHLRALARWPERIVAQLPTAGQSASERFWNFKIPVFSKLVDPPHATLQTQRACLAAILAASEAVEKSATTLEGTDIPLGDRGIQGNGHMMMLEKNSL